MDTSDILRNLYTLQLASVSKKIDFSIDSYFSQDKQVVDVKLSYLTVGEESENLLLNIKFTEGLTSKEISKRLSRIEKFILYIE